MAKASTKPIPLPADPKTRVSAESVHVGAVIAPIDRIKVFSPQQWEEFVLEWVDSLRLTYELVERCGGAGDMGRDVVATVKKGYADWDNYQCKHYEESLKPSDIWIELGKLAYYTKRGDYSYPRHYYFIAPKGAGTELSNLLKKPDELKAGLLNNWATKCRKKITSVTAVELDDAMKDHINSLNFSIFEATPVLRIIDEHAKTRYYAIRFGGGLPSRPNPSVPPAKPAMSEAVFIGELRRAYADHLKVDVSDLDDQIGGRKDLLEHLADSRLEFYSAEGLRTFSRDTLPPGSFEELQEEVHSGIRDDLRDDHPDGYRRVVSVVKSARTLPLSGHPLSSRIHNRDRGGICHQLANNGKVRWVK